jgi:Ca2+-binding RTX toxin-like protein
MRPVRLVAVLVSVLVLSSGAVALAATITGSEDDDVLIGTRQDDQISGVGGADWILALEGNDRVNGGPGQDVIFGDGSCVREGGALRCGPREGCQNQGPYYCLPPCPADSPSAPPYCLPAGQTAGDDVLRGGDGGDRISGQDGDDRIFGDAGADLLRGGRGDDRIEGGAGRDDVRAGAGDDRIDVADGQFDVVVCGPGFDRVIADRRDDVARNCERLSRG